MCGRIGCHRCSSPVDDKSTPMIVSLYTSTHRKTGTREHLIESVWRHPTPSRNSSESPDVDRQLHAISLQPDNPPLAKEDRR